MSSTKPSELTVDAHCHFWQLFRGDYVWLQGDNVSLAPIRRDYVPMDYPVPSRVIAVQAAASLAETDYLLSLAAGNCFIAGVVGWVDLTDPEAVAMLEGKAANPHFKGVRPMLQDIADTDWLTTAPRRDALEALIRLGLRFDALITPRHLPVLARFAAENPDLPIVINHAAKPRTNDLAAWMAGMRRLADDGRIYCKLSGLLTELSARELEAPFAPLREIVLRLLEWFGPDRLIWGSDWPVLTLAATYEEWSDLTDNLLKDLTVAERAAVMGGNAIRFYGLTSCNGA